jgi:hypothetical protein
MSDNIKYLNNLSTMVERDWEMLGEVEQEASSPEAEALAVDHRESVSPKASVERIWSQKSSVSSDGSTTLSCEDVIERSEQVLNSGILAKGEEEGRRSSGAREGGGEKANAETYYRLFDPVRIHLERSSKQMCKSLSTVFGRHLDASHGSSGLAKLVQNQNPIALSLGFLNVVLSFALVQAYVKNAKVTSELQKRGQVIYKLIGKLYEMKLSYNAVSTIQPHLLEVTWHQV